MTHDWWLRYVDDCSDWLFSDYRLVHMNSRLTGGAAMADSLFMTLSRLKHDLSSSEVYRRSDKIRCYASKTRMYLLNSCTHPCRFRIRSAKA
jgi:hypothetical protein